MLPLSLQPTVMLNVFQHFLSIVQTRTSSHINRLSKRFALVIACELDLEINIAFMGVRTVWMIYSTEVNRLVVNTFYGPQPSNVPVDKE